MRSWVLILFGTIIAALTLSALIYSQKIPLPSGTEPSPNPSSLSSPLATPSSSPTVSPSTSPEPNGVMTNPNPDLTVDTNGLSKATVILNTSEGIIKYKFYPNDAPKTVKRMIELINKGFYNGLTFHRIVPGFVIQGGDPIGNGTGGSGQKLEAEFNQRRHIEGTLAMARATDPNSADSQFYITLGTHPHLDGKYTIFGQVIEGMDVAKKIKQGDKIMAVFIE